MVHKAKSHLIADSEQYRHACEVNHVMSLPGSEKRREYILGVEKIRGKQAADRIRFDCEILRVQSMENEGRKKRYLIDLAARKGARYAEEIERRSNGSRKY